MPAMPSAASASLTASTLSGRTIAFKSFTLHPRSGGVNVSLFTVSREVDADLFVALRRTKREGERDQFQQDKCQNAAVDNSGGDRDGLRDQLPGIAEQEPVSDAVQTFLRKHAGEEGAHGAADAVRRHHVE